MASWPPFLQAIYANSSSLNSTAPFPASMMDTLLSSTASASPLLQVVIFIYRRIGEQLGLDPSTLLASLVSLWFLYKIYTLSLDMVNKHMTCDVTVFKGDLIYDQLMQLLSEFITNSRHVTIETQWKGVWDEVLDEKGESNELAGRDGSPKLRNFAGQAARSVSKYILVLH